MYKPLPFIVLVLLIININLSYSDNIPFKQKIKYNSKDVNITNYEISKLTIDNNKLIAISLYIKNINKKTQLYNLILSLSNNFLLYFDIYKTVPKTKISKIAASDTSIAFPGNFKLRSDDGKRFTIFFKKNKELITDSNLTLELELSSRKKALFFSREQINKLIAVDFSIETEQLKNMTAIDSSANIYENISSDKEKRNVDDKDFEYNARFISTLMLMIGNDPVGDSRLGMVQSRLFFSAYKKVSDITFFFEFTSEYLKYYQDTTYEKEIGDYDNLDVLLRQFYIEYTFEFDNHINNINLRVGKQNVDWGKVSGPRPVEVINHQDYRFFLFDKRSDRRLGDWMVRFNASIIDSLNVVGIWNPVFEPNKLAPPYSAFEGEWQTNIRNSNISLIEAEKPSMTIKHSNLGFRTQYHTKQIDTSLYLFQGYEHSPYLSITGFSSSGAPDEITKKFSRFNMIGADIEKDIYKKIILRGELAYQFNSKLFPVISNADNLTDYPDGTIARDVIKYAFGFRNRGLLLPELYLNLQYTGHTILNHSDTLIYRPPMNHTLFLDSIYTFENLNLEVEFMTVYQIEEADYWLVPMARYKAMKDLTFSMGFWFFGGKDNNTTFGQYRLSDLIYAQATYNF